MTSSARLARVAQRVDGQEPRRARLVEAEEPAQAVVEDVDHALVAALEQLRAVGTEVDRRAVRQQAVAVHPDAEPLAHRAARAVGGDDVAGAHGAIRAGLQIAQDRGDAVAVVVERDDQRRVAQPGAELLGAGAQQRLERVLGDEQPPRRAELLDPGVEVGDVAGGLAAGDRLDRVDAAVGEELRLRHPPDRVLEVGGAHQLERAQVEVPGARVDRGSAVALGHERRHAVLGEEQRGRQADHAASHDQDRDLFDARRHLVHEPLLRLAARTSRTVRAAHGIRQLNLVICGIDEMNKVSS